MTIYDDARSVAQEVMAEFKQGNISYIAVTRGTGTRDDPGKPAATPYAINATAQGVAFKYVQSGQAAASDLQVNIPADDRYTPEKTGFVDIDGIRYKIVEIVKKPAAGTVVLYVLIIRKLA